MQLESLNSVSPGCHAVQLSSITANRFAGRVCTIRVIGYRLGFGTVLSTYQLGYDSVWRQHVFCCFPYVCNVYRLFFKLFYLFIFIYLFNYFLNLFIHSITPYVFC